MCRLLQMILLIALPKMFVANNFVVLQQFWKLTSEFVIIGVWRNGK